MIRTGALLAAAALLAAPAGWSHHNFAAHYRQDEMIEISGMVQEFRFVNPHVRVYLEVPMEDGQSETWMAEGDASVALRRSGWTENQLKPGDEITIVGNPARSGANMLGWESVRLADGTDIGGGDGRVGERARFHRSASCRVSASAGPAGSRQRSLAVFAPDLLIAATALEHGLTVATRNVRHFQPTGVPVLDPSSPEHGAVHE